MRNKFWSKNISKNMAHFGFENRKTKWKKYQQCYISFAIASQGENLLSASTVYIGTQFYFFITAKNVFLTFTMCKSEKMLKIKRQQRL